MRFNIRRFTPTKQLIFAVTAVFAFVLQPMLSVNIPSAFATAGDVVNIHNVSDLRSAIEGQEDGQTWNIYGGSDYGLSAFNTIGAGAGFGTQTNNTYGWYFPIIANNVTIRGIGNPTIYGTGFTQNGAWATQNFVTIFGNNVTIKNLTLMPKIEPNKTVEVLGSNSTIQGVTITPNTKTASAEFDQPMTQSGVETKQGAINWGGSIYYNNASGTNTLSNVAIKNGGVRFLAPSATLNMSDVNITYNTNIDWINSYRIKGTGVINGAPTYTYQVSNDLNNINSALNAIDAPSTIKGTETIKLVSDLFANSQITINKPNVMINAKKAGPGYNYYTIFGNYDKTNGSNNSVLSVQADGVRISELNIDGQNHQLHGINAYKAEDLQISNVTLKNNSFSGLNINRSQVHSTDFTTANNGWRGVDIDGDEASLLVDGINQHNETLYHTDNGKTKPVPALYVDNANVGTVNDTNSQYVHIDGYWKTGDRAYFLASDVKPVEDLRIKYQQDASYLADGAVVDQISKSVNNKLVLDFDKPTSTFPLGHYITTETRPDGTGATQWNGYNNTWITQHGFGFGSHGNGEYTYMVTVFYANGLSATSNTISLWYNDHQAPLAPTNLRWVTSAGDTVADNGTTNLYGGTAEWDASASQGVAHYIYKYWNDIPGNSYSSSNKYPVNVSGLSLVGVFNQGQGVHHFCVIAVDSVGNQSDCNEATYTITYNFAPTINSVATDKTTTRTISGTSAPLADVSVTVHSTPKTQTTKADKDGSWKVTFTGLEVGNHTVTAVSTDTSNNTSSTTTTTFAVIDPNTIVSGNPPSDLETSTKPSNTTPPARSPFVAVAPGTVLGDETNTSNADKTPATDSQSVSDGSEVKAAADDKTADNSNSFAWFWWVIALAIIALGWWMIAAARRRRSSDDI